MKWSRSVEILYKNEEGGERLAKVHFRLHPEVSMQQIYVPCEVAT